VVVARGRRGGAGGPLYDRATLGAGDGFVGPAIVTQLDATTLVAEGWRARMDATGVLILER
jgi:N-methylhydantoinase A